MALVERERSAGTTSLFKSAISSALSFSSRSAKSATDLLTRAPASPTLRLKSLIDVTCGREYGHSCVADTRLAHYFVLQDDGQARRIQAATGRSNTTQVSAGRFSVESRHAQTADGSSVVIDDDAVVG